MVNQKITKDPELKRIQKGACMKWAGGQSWEVGLEHEVRAQANIAVDLKLLVSERWLVPKKVPTSVPLKRWLRKNCCM